MYTHTDMRIKLRLIFLFAFLSFTGTQADFVYARQAMTEAERFAMMEQEMNCVTQHDRHL